MSTNPDGSVIKIIEQWVAQTFLYSIKCANKALVESVLANRHDEKCKIGDIVDIFWDGEPRKYLKVNKDDWERIA